jgi:hypothetical protein
VLAPDANAFAEALQLALASTGSTAAEQPPMVLAPIGKVVRLCQLEGGLAGVDRGPALDLRRVEVILSGRSTRRGRCGSLLLDLIDYCRAGSFGIC